MEKLVCDLSHPVWLAPNSPGQVSDGIGGFCALGKAYTACGFSDHPRLRWRLASDQFVKILGQDKLNSVFHTNDVLEDHTLAVKKILQFMAESGKVNFINGQPVFNNENQQETTKQTQEESTETRAAEPAPV